MSDIKEFKSRQSGRCPERRQTIPAAQSVLCEFAGALAHELNQPLTSILSNAQAAQRFLASDTIALQEVRSILEDVVRDARAAAEVMQQIRTWLSRGEMRFQALSADEIVHNALVAANDSLLERDVVVVTKFAPHLPRVKGDAEQLREVFRTLLDRTAGIACEQGHGRIVEVAAHLDESREHLEFLIGAQRAARAAPAGTTADLSPQSRGDDNRLSFAICQSLILLHGGGLWAANDPACGAQFRCTLPVCKESSA